MCIAIVNKKGTLPLSTFTTSFKNNRDGIGLAWSEDGEVRTLRTMNAPDQLHERYLEIRESNDLPILIHARIGTHGVKDLGNCHPFKVNKTLALIHNGIVSAPTYRPDRSDTWHLVDLMKQFANPAAFMDATTPQHQWLKELAGYSKIAMLDGSGKCQIIGETRGTWEGDTWYSNATWKESCTVLDKGGKTVSNWQSTYKYGWNDDDVLGVTWKPREKTKVAAIYPTTYDKARFILDILDDDRDLPQDEAIKIASEYAKSWGYQSMHTLYQDAQTWKA
jgi:hypothetical protein